MCGFFGLEDVLHKEEEFACTAYKELLGIGWRLGALRIGFRTKGIGWHLAISLDQSQV